MKVVLIQDVEKLGAVGEIITVKDGYARNYLIPGGFALKADRGGLRRMEGIRQAAEAKTLRELKTHQAMAARLAKTELLAQVQTGEENRMFGAVTSSDIAEMLAAKGIDLDRRIIDLPDPIKSLGVYHVPVKLHTDVEARVKVVVEAEPKAE